MIPYEVFFKSKTESPDLWQELENIKIPIVLYGMGNGADKILEQFYKHSIKISAVIASDDFVRGQSFHGFLVQNISQIEARFDRFVIILAFGTCLPEVMERIKNIAARHELIVPTVPVCGDEVFDSSFFIKHITELYKSYALMSDDESRRVFSGVIDFYLSGSLNTLSSLYSEKDEFFQSVLKLSQDEDYLDLGAYCGDTIEEFLRNTKNSFNTITALEPNRRSFAKLMRFAEYMPNTLVLNKAVGDSVTTHKFNDSSGRGSTLNSKAKTEIEVTTVDTLFENCRLSYLKADIEGGEYDMLLGAKNTIQRDRPKINIAAYHKSSDLFRLPLLIHNLVPEYKIYLRQHPYIPAWDLNFYACV